VFNGTKTFDEVAKDVGESFKDSFQTSDTKKSFTTYLPTGITLGGSYRLTKRFNVGVLSYSRIISRQFRETFTVSGNLNLGNAFSTSLCYTAANHRFDNLGAGLAFRAGIFQFYMLSDKIPVQFNRIKSKNSDIMLPASWNTINLRLGMNITFGNRMKKKEVKPPEAPEQMQQENPEPKPVENQEQKPDDVKQPSDVDKPKPE